MNAAEMPTTTQCAARPPGRSPWRVPELALLATWMVWSSVAPTLYGQITASVTVNATQALSTMSPLGLGLHTSPYYNNMSHPLVDDRLEEAGVTTLRFGGGGYADVFHWSIGRAQWLSGVTGGGLSPWWGEPTNFGYVGEGSDFGSFVRLLDQLEGGRAVVTVNSGSAMKLVGGQSAVPDFGGQPKEAAAWVAYANSDPSIYGTPADIPIGVDEQGNDWKTAGYWARLRASTAAEYQAWAQAEGVYEPLNAFLAIDRDAPVGIEYWEIGNETFGTNYYGTNPADSGYSVDYDLPYGTDRRGHPNLSPAQYGQEVVEYSQLMKSIDPTIKIGAVLSTPPDDWSWDYYPKTSAAQNNPNNHWNWQVLGQAADAIDFVMVHWYPYAGENANGDSLLAEVRNKLPRMIGGTTPGADTGQNAGLRDILAEHGIPDAEIMVTEFNYFGSLQGSLANAAESIFVADAYATWLEQGVTSVQYLEMLTKDFLSDTSGFARGSAFYGVSMIDKLIEPGEKWIAAATSNNTVRVHAAVQDDGSVAVMLLNLSRTSAANVTVDIDGVLVGEAGTRFALTGGTNLTQSAASGLGNMFTVSVPARSIATYILPAVQPGDYNGDGEVDAADYPVWRATLGSTTLLGADGNSDEVVDLADFEPWQANFGRTLVGAAGIATDGQFQVPEPTGVVVVGLGLVSLWLSLGRHGRVAGAGGADDATVTNGGVSRPVGWRRA